MNDINDNPTELIDLQKVLASKNVKAPRWVVSLLGRLLHVDEINQGLAIYHDKQGPEFADAILDYLNVSVDLVNSQRIPADGNPIIVANHPLGGPDGMALIAAVGRIRKDIKFPVNDFLMALPNLRDVFVPIDKVHGNRLTANGINEAFAADNILLYFPAGLCSRRQNGVIADLPWKTTVVKKALAHQRTVIPVFIDAHNRRRFYSIANLRKRLGIKFNFEMALLPGEMFAQRGNTFRMVVGNPVDWRCFDNGESPVVWAERLRQYVYTLRQNPDADLILK